MKPLRSILTTLVTLLITLVVLASLSTLASFLLLSKASTIHDRVHELHTEMLRGGGQIESGGGGEAAPTAEVQDQIALMQSKMGEKDQNIDRLQQQLVARIQESRNLEAQLQQLMQQGFPPPPAPGGESALRDNSAASQAVGLAPKVAQVQRYDFDYNFVVLNAGLDKGLKQGQALAVRRAKEIVAQVSITRVDDNTSVAEVVSGTVPEGVKIEEGDDIIALPGQ